MAEANISRQALVEAIAALESRQGADGNSPSLELALKVALAALRDKLAAPDDSTSTRTYPSLAVLVADLVGFTALSESMDAENVRAALNAMWQVLDKVIRAWGGEIAQHAGDSLLALFGTSRPRQGDAERALQAALAMQTELRLFNERIRRRVARPDAVPWMAEWPAPQMRIGVHAGPVYFAKAGADGPQVAIGESVAVARWLERQAPAGSVLTSAVVLDQVKGRVEVTAVPSATPGRETATALLTGEQVYRVNHAHRSDESSRFSARPTLPSHLLGRNSELENLQALMQSVVDSGVPRMVVLVGDPGSGKTRLLQEFAAHANVLSGPLSVLYAGMDQPWPAAPYSLVRDLILRRFDLRPQHSRWLVTDRLHRALSESDQSEPSQLIGVAQGLLDIKSSVGLPSDEVLNFLMSLLRNDTARGSVLLILDNILRADSESLTVLLRLLGKADNLPVLVAATVDSSTTTHLPEWLSTADAPADPFAVFQRLDLPPLSPVNSRLMATAVLHRLASTPMRLVDLIVAESAGNPLYIEAFTRLLVKRGIIIGDEQWQVDMSRAESLRLPKGLTELFQLQLAGLPDEQRQLLQCAAVMGSVCWDAALAEMLPTHRQDAHTFESALAQLESEGFLRRNASFSFGDAQAYAFDRSIVRDAAASMLTPEARRNIHRRAAVWLIAHQQIAPFNTWLPVSTMIAWHLHQAGTAAHPSPGARWESSGVSPVAARR